MKALTLKTPFAALCLVAAPVSFAAGNAEAGKAKATTCAACHGADGAKPVAPAQPVLAGQYADYLAKAISDYKSGARNNAIMKGFAAGLSNQDIQDLAAWFASQGSALSTKR